MAEPLFLSKDLRLPIEVAGQVIALVGIRNSGKTNSAGVIAEELLDRDQQVVFIDPTDASWGLRSGYPIFIFGGPHGDIPLAEKWSPTASPGRPSALSRLRTLQLIEGRGQVRASAELFA